MLLIQQTNLKITSAYINGDVIYNGNATKLT